MPKRPKKKDAFARLVQVMSALRAPDGCPWDKRQTHKSLKPYLLEEAYELIEAIDSGDPQKLRGEIGDLLLQAVFHAQLAAERGDFDIYDSVNAVADKLIRRHPHVFSGKKAGKDDRALWVQWEDIKRKEQQHASRKSALDGVPKALPALLRASRVLSKAGKARFQWSEKRGAWKKLEEELEEFREASGGRNRKHAEEELGDLLLALVNVARFEGFDAEHALHAGTDKLMRRFRHVEKRVEDQGKDWGKVGLKEMMGYWREAKTSASSSPRKSRPSPPGRARNGKSPRT
jgi:tetrapyrrole methylase family protein/MazG family protein